MDWFYYLIKSFTGNRNCIGQNFAITELKMAVAKLIYNFEVVAHQPENVTRISTGIMKPINLYLKFIPRQNSNWLDKINSTLNAYSVFLNGYIKQW